MSVEWLNVRLQDELFCLWILGYVGGETHSGGAFAGRVLSPRHEVVDVLQQLRFTRAWVSAQQNVQLSPAQNGTTFRLDVCNADLQKLHNV